MKRFIVRTFFLLAPFLVLIIIINYLVDPAKVFDQDYENKMIDILNAGSFVTNISNYDERIFKKKLIERLETKPDIAILGSSRTMLIGSNYFKGKKLINCSVSGAAIEDLIALFQILKLNGKLPKEIILGVDPWIFNPGRSGRRWKSVSSDYYSFFNEKNLLPEFTKYEQLISFSYFQESVYQFISKSTEETVPKATTSKYNNLNTILTDGSLVYSKSYRESIDEQRELLIQKYISKGIYGFENYYTISENSWNSFEKLLKVVLENEINLSILLIPYHPVVYQQIEDTYPIVIELENMLHDCARSNRLPINGSFNPFILEIDDTDFYDGMHMTEEGIGKLLMKQDNH